MAQNWPQKVKNFKISVDFWYFQWFFLKPLNFDQIKASKTLQMISFFQSTFFNVKLEYFMEKISSKLSKCKNWKTSSFSTFLGSSVYNYWATSLHIMVLKTQHKLILVPNRQFWTYNFQLFAGISITPKIHETTKKHVFWQINPNFGSNHESVWILEFNWPEQWNNRVFKLKFGKKKRNEVHQF